ncbi:MAG: antibiotic biosynthesis monooxygenase family protein [Chloroflexota bacterium]
MAVQVVVRSNVLQGKGDAFVTAWLPRLAEVRNEPGCEQYDLFRSIEDLNKFVMVERWTDEATFEAHRALNRTRPSIAAELRDGASVLRSCIVE